MQTRTKRIRCRLVVLVGLAASIGILTGLDGDAWAQGCAMCRTALGSEDDPLARGFYWSVLFMVSAPYLVIGSIGGWLFYRHRDVRRRSATAPDQAPPEPGLAGREPGRALIAP